MKWFKHYENAHTNRLIQALLSEKNGHELHSMYWLFMGLLCGEFKKDTTEFILSVDQIRSSLHVVYDKKAHRFMKVLGEFSSRFDQDLFNLERISEKFYKIETPIILELMGKDFKRTRTDRGSATAKKKEERIKNKKENKNKNILSSKASTICVEVVDYLNLLSGKKYKSSSTTTRGVINARVAEGYELEDFKTVIDKKCRAWIDDPKMAKFIRPQTLFGNKFESYLNEHEVLEKSKAQKTQDDLIEMYREFDCGN